jgi:hypothetical protein
MKDEMRAKVKGELFEAISGHHHTSVLMTVTDAEKEDRLPIFNLNEIKISCEPDGFCEANEASS